MKFENAPPNNQVKKESTSRTGFEMRDETAERSKKFAEESRVLREKGEISARSTTPEFYGQLHDQAATKRDEYLEQSHEEAIEINKKFDAGDRSIMDVGQVTPKQPDTVVSRQAIEQEKINEIKASIATDNVEAKSVSPKKKEAEEVAMKSKEGSEIEIKGERLLGMLKRLNEMGPKGVPLDTKDAEEYAKLDAEARVLNGEYGALRRERENIGGKAKGRSMQEAFERTKQAYRNEVLGKLQKQHEHAERHEQTMETIRKQMNHRPFWGDKTSRPYLLQPELYGAFGFLAKGANWLTKKLTMKEEAPKEKAEVESWDEMMKRMDDNDKQYAREIMDKSDEELDQLVSVYNERQGGGVTGTQVSLIHDEIANRKERTGVIKDESKNQEASPKKYDIPLDSGLLVKYGKENFGFFQVADLDGFKKIWEKKGYAEHFGQYTEALVGSLIKNKAQGLKYPGTVAAVFTNGGQDIDILTKLITVKTGKEPARDELLKMPFSKVAREYLGLDVEKIDKGYFEHFRKRE